jgi:acetyltransferase-like isoleucine patch superfamily enzyme
VTGVDPQLRNEILLLVENEVHERVEAELQARIAPLVAEAVERARWGPQVYGDERKLHVHPTAVVNDALFNLSSGEITVEKYAFFGHRVAVLTGTHDITKFGRERQTTFPRSGRDVVIEEGVWVASHAMVLGPVRIGKHAVVAAGSLVLDDVAPYTVVAGRPAKVIKKIGEADQR